MKKALFTFAMVAALLAGTSCSKEDLNEVSEINGIEESVVLPDEILASVDDSEFTKAVLAADGLTPYWTETDSFYVYNGGNTSTPAVVVWYKFERYKGDGTDKTKAYFKKVGDGVLNQNKAFYAFYGCGYIIDKWNNVYPEVPEVYNYQEGKISNMPMCAKINGGVMGNLTFLPMSDILAVKVKNTTVKKIRISSDNIPFSGEVRYTIGDGTSSKIIMNSKKLTVYEINCGDGVVTGSEGKVFYFPVPNASSRSEHDLSVNVKGLKVEISTDGTTFPLAMVANKDVTFAKNGKKSVIYKVDFKANAMKLYEGSTFWAIKNIGAADKFAVGKYYTWGNTGEKTSINTTYLQTLVDLAGKWYSDVNGTATTEKTSAAYGDVATKELGQSWQTPNKDDFQTLLDSCDWVWDNDNKGFNVKATNPALAGHAIFIPAGGYKDEYNELAQFGEYCHYWSSAPNTDATAYFLCVKTTSVLDKTVAFNPRNLGYNVRAVKKAQVDN